MALLCYKLYHKSAAFAIPKTINIHLTTVRNDKMIMRWPSSNSFLYISIPTQPSTSIPLPDTPSPLECPELLSCQTSIPRAGRLWLWYWYPKICSDKFPRTGAHRCAKLPPPPRYTEKCRKYSTFPTAIFPPVTSKQPSRLVYRCPNSNSYLPQ